MRRLLLWLACMSVGSITIGEVVALLPAGRSHLIVAVIVSWSTVVGVGVVLSAPFFLNPPDTRGGLSVGVPIFFWVFMMVIRLIWWTGFTVLRGVWSVIYLLFRRPAPTASGPS